MSLELTKNSRLAAEAGNLEPNIVLEIDGVATKFGAAIILKYIRIGDPDLYIGNDWRIGGKSRLEGQEDLITFDGTTTNISQKLDIDKASGASISQMSVALQDAENIITELITPGNTVVDMLARKCTVWMGFANTAYPDDYIPIFRGIIDDIHALPGRIIFQISHPDQKKRSDIFIKAESTLDGSIDAFVTTININNAVNFSFPILGANGLFDSTIQYGIRIDDEIIFYTGITGNQLTGVTRAQLGTTGTSHDDEANVEAFIKFGPITAMDAALKIMLSGWNGPYQTGLTPKNINILGDVTVVPNAVYFQGINLQDVYGIVAGDYYTSTGSAYPSNNVTNKIVDEVILTDEGSYLVIADVTFVDDPDTTLTCSFRSQYDVLHPNCGIGLHNNEVDILEHEKLKRWFLSSFEYDFYIRDTVQAKDFIEKEIYFPCAAYSLPRKSRSSVGYHIGPLPTSDVRTVDETNTIGATKLGIRRSIARNFYNTIVYQFEERVLEEDKFYRGRITVDTASKVQIPVGTRALVIPSKGMREVLSGQTQATSASNRRLRRYKKAAEYIEGLQVTFGESYNLEIGDVIVLDLKALKMSDTKSGTREGEPRLFECYNKSFDIKTGKVTVSLVDTAYSTTSRYFLLSPSTRLGTGSTDIKLKLKVTGNTVFRSNEGRKWSRYIGAIVRVRSDDFTTRNATAKIQSVSGNTLTLETSLGFTPLEDDTLTLAHYNDEVDEVGDKLKLLYGWMTNDPAFDDGKIPYQTI